MTSSKDDQGYRIAFTVKSRSAFRLYEQFRPTVPAGTGGWGAKGKLDLEKIRAPAQSA